MLEYPSRKSNGQATNPNVIIAKIFIQKIKNKNCNARLQNWSIYISSLISHYITELRFFFGLMIRCA